MQKTDNIYISIFDYLCYCYLESLSAVTEENVVLMEKKKNWEVTVHIPVCSVCRELEVKLEKAFKCRGHGQEQRSTFSECYTERKSFAFFYVVLFSTGKKKRIKSIKHFWGTMFFSIQNQGVLLLKRRKEMYRKASKNTIPILQDCSLLMHVSL